MVGDVYFKGVSQMAIGSNLCIFTHLSHLKFIHLGYNPCFYLWRNTKENVKYTHCDCDINFLLGSNFIYFKPHSICIFGIPFAMNFILVQIM